MQRHPMANTHFRKEVHKKVLAEELRAHEKKLADFVLSDIETNINRQFTAFYNKIQSLKHQNLTPNLEPPQFQYLSDLMESPYSDFCRELGNEGKRKILLTILLSEKNDQENPFIQLVAQELQKSKPNFGLIWQLLNIENNWENVEKNIHQIRAAIASPESNFYEFTPAREYQLTLEKMLKSFADKLEMIPAATTGTMEQVTYLLSEPSLKYYLNFYGKKYSLISQLKKEFDELELIHLQYIELEGRNPRKLILEAEMEAKITCIQNIAASFNNPELRKVAHEHNLYPKTMEDRLIEALILENMEFTHIQKGVYVTAIFTPRKTAYRTDLREPCSLEQKELVPVKIKINNIAINTEQARNELSCEVYSFIKNQVSSDPNETYTIAEHQQRHVMLAQIAACQKAKASWTLPSSLKVGLTQPDYLIIRKIRVKLDEQYPEPIKNNNGNPDNNNDHNSQSTATVTFDAENALDQKGLRKYLNEIIAAIPPKQRLANLRRLQTVAIDRIKNQQRQVLATFQPFLDTILATETNEAGIEIIKTELDNAKNELNRIHEQQLALGQVNPELSYWINSLEAWKASSDFATLDTAMLKQKTQDLCSRYQTESNIHLEKIKTEINELIDKTGTSKKNSFLPGLSKDMHSGNTDEYANGLPSFEIKTHQINAKEQIKVAGAEVKPKDGWLWQSTHIHYQENHTMDSGVDSIFASKETKKQWLQQTVEVCLVTDQDYFTMKQENIIFRVFSYSKRDRQLEMMGYLLAHGGNVSSLANLSSKEQTKVLNYYCEEKKRLVSEEEQALIRAKRGFDAVPNPAIPIIDKTEVDHIHSDTRKSYKS